MESVSNDQPPIRLEISINGQVKAIAGIDKRGVVHASAGWVSAVDKEDPTEFTRYELTAGAGGRDSVSGERPEWLDEPLSIGDLVNIRVRRNVNPTTPANVQPPPTPEMNARLHLDSLVAGLEMRVHQDPEVLLTSYDGEFITTAHVLKRGPGQR